MDDLGFDNPHRPYKYIPEPMNLEKAAEYYFKNVDGVPITDYNKNPLFRKLAQKLRVNPQIKISSREIYTRDGDSLNTLITELMKLPGYDKYESKVIRRALVLAQFAALFDANEEIFNVNMHVFNMNMVLDRDRWTKMCTSLKNVRRLLGFSPPISMQEMGIHKKFAWEHDLSTLLEILKQTSNSKKLRKPCWLA